MTLPDPLLSARQAQRLRTVEAWFADRQPRTLLVGDSRAALWPKDLLKLVGRKTANLGISLTQVQDHIRQIETTAIDLSQARVAVVVSGFNNLNRTDAGPEAIAAGVCALVDAIRERAAGAAVLVLAVFPADPAPSPLYRSRYSEGRRLALNAALDEAAPRRGFRLVDTGLGDPHDPALYSDWVHPTRLAYERHITPATVAAL